MTGLVLDDRGRRPTPLLAPFLTARVDQQLTSVAQPSNIGRYIEYAQHPDTTLPGAAEHLVHRSLQSNGTTVLTVPDDLLLHPMNLTAADRQTLARHPNSYHTVTTSDGTELRVLPAAVTFSVNGQTVPGVAVVGLSMHDVDSTLQRLVRLELLLGIAAVALAAGVTAWGVRAGLRPLHRVTRTAQEVTAELSPDGSGLDRRVPVEGAAIEVEQVASSVNTLLQAVETEFSARVASEERMRQFLADASHELRTPLTSIRGYAELSRLQSASGEAADDSMRRIEIEGTRMSRLVEDLLVLARGDQGASLEVAEIAVDTLLTEGGHRGARGPSRPHHRGGGPVRADRGRRLGPAAAGADQPHHQRRGAHERRADPAVGRAGGRRPLGGAAGQRQRPRVAAGAGRARLRAVLAGGQGTQPGQGRQRPRAWPSSPRSCRRTAARCTSTPRWSRAPR